MDSPIVVASSGLGYAASSLVAEDGTVVELREQRRLVPPDASTCVKHSYAFLAATQELAPNTRYTLTARFDNEGASEIDPRSEVVKTERATSFVTGTERRDPTPPEVRLSLFGAQTGRSEAMLLVSPAGQSPRAPGCGLSAQKNSGSTVAIFGFLLVALARFRSPRRSTC
ncbi:MAG TPA: hypothetical protein VJU61_25885 [Polyangiaceae bacterium]|nr:hypothetical protein [Polyangiaceae bacterium]